MSKRKITLSIISIIIAVMLVILPNNVKAVTTLTTPLYFGIQEFRSGTTPENMAYAIKYPSTDKNSGHKIWQIVKYNNSTGTGNYTTGNYYCVRAEVGFSDTSKLATYNICYDLKTEKATIASSGNSVLQSVVNNRYYNNLLALFDLLYLQGISTKAERTALLEAAGIYEEDYPKSGYITDSDIEAVQQAAVWYYTEYGNSLYDNYDSNFTSGGELTKTSWLSYNTEARDQKGQGYTSLSDYNVNYDTTPKSGDGIDRQEQAVYLYNYLIYTANQNANAYANGTANSRTKVTLYANSLDQNVQPFVSIERMPEEQKEFDLSIRKYVTKVDGVSLTGTNTRVPNIEKSTIETNGTATYKHRKDPVVVNSGSTVTYNLTVYNEGEKAGRATKIVDQLATGLESKLKTGSKVTSTKGNEYTVTYDATTNRIILETNGTKNLNAYNGSTLDSDTIQIECIVTAKASTESEKILTNVAWIDAEYDAVDNITIINQDGKDRDSKPSTTPSVNKDNMSNYLGNSTNKADLTDSNYYYKGQEDDDDFEKVKLEKQNVGSYNIILVKQDANGAQLNIPATFEVDGVTKQVTGRTEIVSNKTITPENLLIPDTYTIKETVAPNKYCKFNGTITVTVTKKEDNGNYKIDQVTYKVTDENGKDITFEVGDILSIDKNKSASESGNLYIELKNYQFDLKLIKRIVEVNGTKVPERILGVDITALANGTATTATYDIDKTPVAVKKGDIVKYAFRVYNEGNIDGYASEITEDIPDGLEFIWSEKDDSELNADTSLSNEEKEAIKYNQSIWDIKDVNKNSHKVELISTDYLSKGKGAEITTNGANLIKAFDPSKGYINTINDRNPDYREVSVYLKVTAENATKVSIRNEAAITGNTDSDGNPVEDRDSNPDNWVKYEDDEDYDTVVLQSFDLALRKFIIAVSKDTTIEDSEYLKNSNGTYTRAPIVDTSKLNTVDQNGNVITTAIYKHSKEPIEVTKNDIVVYMIRAYNEGDIDGYASTITDHLPQYLEYVDSDFNKQYGWQVSSDGRTVTTSYLDNHMISKTTTNSNGEIVLSYKEVPIMCKVTDDAQGKITNIADITVSKDADKNVINDRDSEVDNVVLPSDSNLPSYKDDVTGDYIPGQQDDDDFDKVIVKTFDLALRKFITNVDDKDVTSRIPQVKYDEQNNKITYEHSKVPVDVVTGDIVIYTIRVYNEGEIDGYASKVTDDIPNGLQYLPQNELNKEYRWIMYDSQGKETDDVSKAVKITTDYLSKEQGEARMKDDEEITENPALLTAFDPNEEISDTNPDYADVKVAFKVVEPNGSDKIIINSAQISENTDKNGEPVDDIDSTPDKWIDGDDDQDKEYIKLNYFDLALRKWVTHAIVIEDGKETVTATGHKPEDAPEQVVKVEINRKKLNSVTVKFKYSIRVTNEGDIAGYAKEITDYVPDGSKFVASDNSDWTDEGNNVISTRKLENTLLQPGESADVEVILTWINGSNNMGLKTNIAEISEDYNDKDVPDRDSTPDNQVPGEDDQDDAPVLLSISTGKGRIYFTLVFAILITLGSGIALIKKFVF